MNIALAGISFNTASKKPFQDFLDALITNGHSIYCHSAFHSILCKEIVLDKNIRNFDSSSECPAFDLVASIGGDGTFLNAVRLVADTNVPILGVNTGRLGYLTATNLEDGIRAVSRIQNGDFIIDRRTLLKVDSDAQVFGNTNFALNDFTLYRKDSASMITVHVYVDDIFLNTYWSDGLIIATPTGSTAYSLSCGGPIVSSGCNTFVITPVAPHNLTVRPIVVSDKSIIRLSVETRHHSYLATCDSRQESLDKQIEFKVQKAPFTIKLIRFPEQNFPETIRGKLLWGSDRRN